MRSTTVDYHINTAHHIARRTIALMERRRMLLSTQGVVCHAWPCQDRVILIIDPLAIRNPHTLHSKRFQHHLRTVLTGRRVVVTNTRGLFLQISYWPDKWTSSLPDHATLDLAKRPPGRLMVPIGQTHRGPLWLPLPEMDSVLIGGTRQMGKTTLLHSWILALVTGARSGQKVRLILADGKGGTEFGLYARLPRVEVAGTGEELIATLGNLREELARRSALLQRHRVRNVRDLPTATRPPYLVLVVDELAVNLETEGVGKALHTLVALGGAYGVLPVLATQRPDSQVVAGFLKTNLSTRISLPVPDYHDSKIILARTGAEKLPKTKGRILFVWEGRMVEAQGYNVSTDLIAEVIERLEQGDAPVEPPLALQDWEKSLVQVALVQFDGFFPVREVAEAAGVSRRQVENVGREWELQGLLTQAEYEPGTGRKRPRRVTGPLRTLAGAMEL